MTVGDLLDILGDMPSGAEVRIAHNRDWPLQFSIAGVTEDETGVVYLCDGSHPEGENPYVRDTLWLEGYFA